ncbi:MAG: hypothetical protein V7K90_10830 [Nostoc sp.]|uniref:hypothetical protein n=1 Tax=Nostoc sp. TaxID=1180 RepID=UPI002FF83E76
MQAKTMALQTETMALQTETMALSVETIDLLQKIHNTPPPTPPRKRLRCTHKSEIAD